MFMSKRSLPHCLKQPQKRMFSLRKFRIISWKYFTVPIICLITLACSIPCPPPDVPADGTYHPKQKTFFLNDKVVYSCNEGFERNGSEVSICMFTGKWSDQIPFCDKTARLSMVEEDNRFNMNLRRVIDKNTSTCIQMDQAKMHTFTVNTGVAFIYAVRIFLERGPAVLQISLGRGNYTSICSDFDKLITTRQWVLTQCQSSFVPYDRIIITHRSLTTTSICEIQVYKRDGLFSNDRCDHPPNIRIPNGFFEVNRKEATLQCADGFTAVNKMLGCKGNVWIDSRPRCDEILCQPHESNSTLHPGTEWMILDSARKLSIGTRSQLKCSRGYQKVGEPEEVICQNNGTWTKTNATCKEFPAKTKKRLLQYLFEDQDYDKRLRPVKNQKTTVPVTVDLTPLEVKYKTQYNFPWKLDTWLAVKWKDEFLIWSPEDFGNIEQLILPVSKVWIPDMSLYHNNLDSAFLSDVATNVIVRFDGELTWVTLNSILIQFDEKLNNCTVSIKARTYDISQMKVNGERPENKSLTHFKNRSWKLQSIEVSEELGNFSWSKQPFSIIHFNLKFEKS